MIATFFYEARHQDKSCLVLNVWLAWHVVVVAVVDALVVVYDRVEAIGLCNG